LDNRTYLNKTERLNAEILEKLRNPSSKEYRDDIIPAIDLVIPERHEVFSELKLRNEYFWDIYKYLDYLQNTKNNITAIDIFQKNAPFRTVGAVNQCQFYYLGDSYQFFWHNEQDILKDQERIKHEEDRYQAFLDDPENAGFKYPRFIFYTLGEFIFYFNNEKIFSSAYSARKKWLDYSNTKPEPEDPHWSDIRKDIETYPAYGYEPDSNEEKYYKIFSPYFTTFTDYTEPLKWMNKITEIHELCQSESLSPTKDIDDRDDHTSDSDEDNIFVKIVKMLTN
jgi:hypothetical protein